jgi:hypothetical protein
MLSDDQIGLYPGDRKDDVKLVIKEAWTWLEGTALLIDHPRYLGGQIKMLSRRAKQLGQETDIRRAFSARRIPKESLHPAIREDVWSLYHRGKYDTAVF